MTKELNCLPGWGAYHQSEALPHALPIGQNSPQKTPYGLYAEQLSGSAFTRPRHQNFRSWLYRILPSATHSTFTPVAHAGLTIALPGQAHPTQMRWNAPAAPSQGMDFIQGLQTLLYNGSPQQCFGAAIHLYTANQSMEHNYFYNSDGEFLFVPYEGKGELWTEFGKLSLAVGDIAVIPRGIVFQVKCHSPLMRGYLLENYGLPFTLPDLGPIGSNGLANPKDFLIPVAFFEEKKSDCQLYTKTHNQIWQASLDHSPLNVVAWHGNYVPYQYSLKYFNTINTVSFDHPDPSIYTVLTAPGLHAGLANIDFVIFPEKWMVAEHTFRPPYYHRNIMNEYMGLIYGEYDAKATGFTPGGGSLHNGMSAHGPDATTYEQAITQALVPTRYQDTLAFMFESSMGWCPTAFALTGGLLQENYQDCWKDIRNTFDRNWQL